MSRINNPLPLLLLVALTISFFSRDSVVALAGAESAEPNTEMSVLDTTEPDNEHAAQYMVRPQDSLYSIAQMVYGTPTRWRTIYAANTEAIGASPQVIKPGQVLQIPIIADRSSVSCDDRSMTAVELATHRNITLETLQSLRLNRGLILEEICTFPDEKLARAVAKAETPKPDHPDEAVAFRLQQLRDENGEIPADGLSKAAEHVQVMLANPRPGADVTSTSWTWLGPGNIGGRIRSIVIHPTTPDTMWVGSVSGGIWKSSDGGASWHVQNDFMSNMAVSTMAMDPADPDVIYAGTGEGFYPIDGIRGAGVFKTTDGGASWNQLASTANSAWYYVNRLAVHPTDSQIMLAATWSGIWRSTDGGTSWTRVTTSRTLDLNFDPTDGANVIASGSNGLAWYSTDSGVTWTAATGLPASGRVEVAYAPSDTDIVYASADESSGSIYKSANGGLSYTLVNTGSGYLGGQGWYDNIVWVDPTDSDTLIVGGIDLWRSINGGATLDKVSQWQSAPISAHADHHYILEHPGFDSTNNKTVFFGNDGGIYKTSDVYTVDDTSGWQELNNNLGVTQFYGAAGNATSGVIVGGTQDNGTLRYSGNTEGWTKMFGGDGGWSASDPTDPNYFYGEYIYLKIHRSSNGGTTSSYIYLGIADAGVRANFIAPFILDPNVPSTLLAGGADLWRSTNAKATPPTWTSIKPGIGDCPRVGCISAIAVGPGNSDLIWVGHGNGNVYKTANGTAATPTWTRMDTNTPNLPDRYVTRITVAPDNNDIVYVTFGGFSEDNLWRTTDGGSTWSDATGSGVTGLPDVPVRDLEIHADNSAWLYAGTEIGIFTSEDSGSTWEVPHNGPTNTSVDELFWMGGDLVAATHGRGLFRASPTTNFIKVTPTSLATTQQPDVQTPLILRIDNGSSTVLTWNIVEAPAAVAAGASSAAEPKSQDSVSALEANDAACDTPSDLPWLSLSPIDGTTTPATGTDVTVTFDSAGLSAGLYSGTLCLTSNDPTTPLIMVPVALTVESALAVALGFFSVERNDEVVDFIWQTATETGVAGFHILAETRSGKVQLNDELIPSSVIDSISPTDYSFSAATDAAVFYLQEINVNGSIAEYGPFELDLDDETASLPTTTDLTPSLWLPMIER